MDPKASFKLSKLFMIFVVVLAFTGCGEEKVLQVEYSVASGSTQPEFIILVSLAADAAPSSLKINLSDDRLLTSSTFVKNLKACAVGMGWLDRSRLTGFDEIPSSDSDAFGDCFGSSPVGGAYTAGLAANLNHIRIPADISDPLAASNYSFADNANGFLFVLTLFGVSETTTVSRRCYQLAAVRVEGGRFVETVDLTSPQTLTSSPNVLRYFANNQIVSRPEGSSTARSRCIEVDPPV